MSDGSKLLSAVLSSGGLHFLRELDSDMFVGTELNAYTYVANFQRQFGSFPSAQTVTEETGVMIPLATEPVDFYIEKIRSRQIYNNVTLAFPDLRDALKARDVGGITEAIGRMVDATRRKTLTNDIRNVAEGVQDAIRLYEHASVNPGMSGVPTAWPVLDKVTGGYQPGALVTWVARTSMGKSTLLIYQAYTAWLAGHSVLFVTMEMTIEEICRRLMSVHASINSAYIRRGTVSHWNKERLMKVAGSFENVDKFRLFSGGISSKIDHLENYIAEYRPDIVYIDGAYLLTPLNRSKQMNKAEKVEEIYTNLRALALDKQRPIITASQYNRAAGRRGVGGSLETIGYSDEIGKISSLALSIGEGLLPNENTQREITTLKGREGEDITFGIHYTFSPVNFAQLDAHNERDDEDDGEAPASTQVASAWGEDE